MFSFQNSYRKEFPEAEILRPRSIKLDQFTYINDEEADKADEVELDETVVLEKAIETTHDAESIQAVSKRIPLIAVDTSSSRLGETDEGLLYAFRASIVGQVNEKMDCEVFGPYIVHITEGNKQAMYDYFRKLFGLKIIRAPHLLQKVGDRIRNFLERLAQKVASTSIENGIVLWDGSLTGRTIDTPERVIRESLDLAHMKGNSVVAVSKKSWLTLVTGERLLGLLDEVPHTCFVDIHDKIRTRDMARLIGRVHVAKFTPDGFSFRVDISPVPSLTCKDVFGLIMGNSGFYNGYPELLRQAHIHAYFVPNEILHCKPTRLTNII